MRYVFKLQALLNYKDRLKEIAEQELAREIAAWTAARKRLEELEATREACIAELKTKRERGMGVPQYILYFDYLQALSGQIALQERLVENLNEAVLQCRTKLLKISREHKVLERIKEKDLVNFKKSLMKLEEKENDETVILRYSQKGLISKGTNT